MGLLEHRRYYQVSAAAFAAWQTATETWDTPVAADHLQSITISPVLDTDTLKVYGAEEHGLAVVAAYDVALEFGGVTSAIDAILTGRAVTVSGTGSSQTRRRQSLGGDPLPYFGLALQVLADGGDLHLYLPRVQVRSLVGLALAADSQFARPTVTARAYRLRRVDGTLYPVLDELEHATPTALPANFNTAFESID